MRWYYKLLEKAGGSYVYAYSRESRDYDGRIRFTEASQSSEIITPAKGDDNKLLQAMALSHFGSVINEGFPAERSDNRPKRERPPRSAPGGLLMPGCLEGGGVCD